MAIICTSADGRENPNHRTLMPLSCVSPRKVKTTVDVIVSSKERPSPHALDEAVRCAKALLDQPTPLDRESGLGPSAFGHIVVLSPHSAGLGPDALVHDKIQLHLVCPGSVPWKGEGKVRCNGWKMQSTHSKEFHSMKQTKDQEQSSLFNRLRTMLDDARTGLLHGTISDLILDIKPGQNCTIEGVIGHRNIPSIQRGERIVALVKLKVGLSPAAGYTLTSPSRRRQDGSGPACNDPDTELDKLLGTTPVVILSAKLKYRHSLLPLDTSCMSTTDCKLKRPLPSAERPNISSKGFSTKQRLRLVQIQKDFAFHIATHHEPRQAITVLLEDFGNGGPRSACPDYIKLLLNELKYQARTTERFELAEGRPVAIIPRELRRDILGLEHFGQGLFDAADYKPQDWIMDVPDEFAIPFPSTAKVGSQSDATTDEAQRIWLDLKKRSTRRVGRGTGSENRSTSSIDLDATTKRLRGLAVTPWL
ncbi:MAG: hypothetical protein Q9200_006777 [Gallowayella weberi]